MVSCLAHVPSIRCWSITRKSGHPCLPQKDRAAVPPASFNGRSCPSSSASLYKGEPLNGVIPGLALHAALAAVQRVSKSAERLSHVSLRSRQTCKFCDKSEIKPYGLGPSGRLAMFLWCHDYPCIRDHVSRPTCWARQVVTDPAQTAHPLSQPRRAPRPRNSISNFNVCPLAPENANGSMLLQCAMASPLPSEPWKGNASHQRAWTRPRRRYRLP